MKLTRSEQMFAGKKIKVYNNISFTADSLGDGAILRAIGHNKVETVATVKPLADYNQSILFSDEVVQEARTHLLANWKKFEGSTPYNFYQMRKFMAYMVTSHISHYLSSKKCCAGMGSVTYLNRKVLKEMIKTGKFSTHSQLVEVMEKLAKVPEFHTLELKSNICSIEDMLWELDFYKDFTAKEQAILEALASGYKWHEIQRLESVSHTTISKAKQKLANKLAL